jgi:hypothetical protein
LVRQQTVAAGDEDFLHFQMGRRILAIIFSGVHLCRRARPFSFPNRSLVQRIRQKRGVMSHNR